MWLGDKNKALNYAPKSDEMVITVHRWFANKSCLGNWLYARLGDLAAKVTANLGSSDSPATDTLYRVQVGAYKSKANADNMTTESGASVSALKSMDEIAREVIRGDWGNGADRRNRLTSAGYDYAAVQAKVNELLG